MSQRDSLLWAIAENPDDDAPRLVYSDWLEEAGDLDRAEFVRAQVALASPALPADRRDALRLRERQLLDARRGPWCDALGVPADDVGFERGLVHRLRPGAWDGKLLDPAVAPGLATLAELDLSGLGLDDAAVTEFAGKAQLPALRKLALSNNKIADASALARAKGLPRLETLYLADNPLSEGTRAALGKDAGFFRLKALDLGEPEEGYTFTPGQTEVARRKQVREQVVPLARRYFARYERLRSAVLIVAQYWADEADDAVHARLVVSELPEPTLAGLRYSDDGGPDPNIPNTSIKPRYGDGSSSIVALYDTGVRWDSNSGAIPLWAAYAPENGSQEYRDLAEVYAPAVLLFRHGGHEFLPMNRPHLDGVRPEWEDE